jgi:hypothetical protein
MRRACANRDIALQEWLRAGMAPFDFGAWRYARLERRLETYRLIIFFFRKSANAVLSNSLESSAGLTVDGLNWPATSRPNRLQLTPTFS